MCGIIGYSSNQQTKKHTHLVRQLFRESQVRGLHAFGFSYRSSRGIETQKFRQIEDCLKALPTEATSIIGHCRYSTSGDYKKPENNQPLQIEQTAMAFNGVISMATKEQNEAKYGRTYETDNDGEIFLDKFTRDDEWLKFVAESKFSFAGLVLDQNQMIALRNKNRPLYKAKYDNATFFASTVDIFRRAGFQVDPEEVKPGEAVSVN